MKLVDRQFPAFQNQDDRQAGILSRHLPAAGRQIRALALQLRPKINYMFLWHIFQKMIWVSDFLFSIFFDKC